MHNADGLSAIESGGDDDGPVVDLSGDNADLNLQRRFAADCGLPDGLQLLVEAGTGRAEKHSLPGPLALIGSGPDSHVRVDVAGVGDRQVFLLSLDGRMFACDLAGPTGTRHGGRLITKTWLSDRPTVEFGDVTVTPVAAEDRTTDEPSPADGDRVQLDLVFGGGRQTYRVKGEVVLFGGDPRCKLQYRHESVAPVHGAIVCARTSAWLVDFGTPEGVILDGIAVRLAQLHDGCVLTIGDKDVEVRTVAAADGPRVPAVEKSSQGGVSEEFVLQVLERFQDSQRQLLDEMRTWTKDFSATLIEAQQAQSERLQGERHDMRREFVELMRVMAQRLPGPATGGQPRPAALRPAHGEQRLPAPPQQLPRPVVAPTADPQERRTTASEPEELRRRLEEVEEQLDAHQGWLGSLLRRSPR